LFIDPENDQLFCFNARLSLDGKDFGAIEVTLLLVLL
jgi:hypothetical protein